MKYLLYSKSAAQYVDGISVTTSYSTAAQYVEGRNETRPKFSTSALMGNALAFSSIASVRAFVAACTENLANFEFDWSNFRIDAFEEGVTDGGEEPETEGVDDGNASEEPDSGEDAQDD